MEVSEPTDQLTVARIVNRYLEAELDEAVGVLRVLCRPNHDKSHPEEIAAWRRALKIVAAHDATEQAETGGEE